MRRIRSAICEVLGVDILVKTRKEEYVDARGIFIYICIRKITTDYKKISDFLGMDRSTIYNYTEFVMPHLRRTQPHIIQEVMDKFEGNHKTEEMSYKELYYRLKFKTNANNI